MISSRETLSFRISVKGFSFEGCFEDGAKIEFRSDWWRMIIGGSKRNERESLTAPIDASIHPWNPQKTFFCETGHTSYAFVRSNQLWPRRIRANQAYAQQVFTLFPFALDKRKKKRERKKRTLDPPLDLSAKFRNSPMRLDGARAENKRIGTMRRSRRRKRIAATGKPGLS